MSLNLDPNINDPDGFYDELIAAHQGLSKQDSDALNARLILVLANHIGSREVLRSALETAASREAVQKDREDDHRT
jgi:hypothetical protein